MLKAKRHLFDEVTTNIASGNININNCIDSLTETMHVSCQCFGKTFTSKSINRNRKAAWLDDKCKEAKALFCRTKRI